MAANPEDKPKLDDIFEKDDNVTEVLEPNKEAPVTEEPANKIAETSPPVVDTSTEEPVTEPITEKPVVDTTKEETPVETPVSPPKTVQDEPESKELGELKYLRDLVFNDDKLFNQVMKAAKGETTQEPETPIEMPTFPEDETDPAAMKKYYEEKDKATAANTARQIEQALASERKKNTAEQKNIRQQTVWSSAMNSVQSDNNLNQEQLDGFVQWAKNPFGNDPSKYVKNLYSLYQKIHTPETPKEKGSVLTEAAKNIQQTPAIPPVNAANLGGGTPNQEPLSDEDEFNETLFKTIKGARKW